MFVAVEPVRHVQEMLMVYPLNISDVFYCSRLAGVNSTFRAVYPRRIKSRSFSCQSTEDYSVWPQFRFGSIICWRALGLASHFYHKHRLFKEKNSVINFHSSRSARRTVFLNNELCMHNELNQLRWFNSSLIQFKKINSETCFRM